VVIGWRGGGGKRSVEKGGTSDLAKASPFFFPMTKPRLKPRARASGPRPSAAFYPLVGPSVTLAAPGEPEFSVRPKQRPLLATFCGWKRESKFTCAIYISRDQKLVTGCNLGGKSGKWRVRFVPRRRIFERPKTVRSSQSARPEFLFFVFPFLLLFFLLFAFASFFLSFLLFFFLSFPVFRATLQTAGRAACIQVLPGVEGAHRRSLEPIRCPNVRRRGKTEAGERN